MDHAEACEILEIAAAEPGGLERVMAGDTPDAAALAGHLVGCADCGSELGRLRRVERLLRGTVSEIPPPELRERTLSFVRAVGRDRSAEAAAAAAVAPAAVAPAAVAPAGITPAPGAIARIPLAEDSAQPPVRPAAGRPIPFRPIPFRRASLWVASLAAAVAISVIATSAWVGGSREAQLQGAHAAVAELASVNSATVQLLSAPDARRVDLAGPNGTGQGLLVFSPSSGEIVMTAVGLTEPAGTWTYRCWALSNGQKRVLGWMRFENGLAYWVGHADGLQALGSGTQFGVSLVDESASGGGNVVLQGTL